MIDEMHQYASRCIPEFIKKPPSIPTPEAMANLKKRSTNNPIPMEPQVNGVSAKEAEWMGKRNACTNILNRLVHNSRRFHFAALTAAEANFARQASSTLHNVNVQEVLEFQQKVNEEEAKSDAIREQHGDRRITMRRNVITDLSNQIA